jgi:hypothetical protein
MQRVVESVTGGGVGEASAEPVSLRLTGRRGRPDLTSTDYLYAIQPVSNHQVQTIKRRGERRTNARRPGQLVRRPRRRPASLRALQDV